jgi:hypothetical protein
MLEAHVSHVLDVLEVCCKCFHTDIAKVDRDVAYVAMVVHVYYKSLSTMFHLFSDVCCKHVYLDVAYVFTHMLQVLYLDVCVCLQWFSSVFASVSDASFKCFICLFCMLHPNVSKVDWVLTRDTHAKLEGARAVPTGARRGQRSVAPAPAWP